MPFRPESPGAAALCLGLVVLAGPARGSETLAVDPSNPQLVARPDLVARIASAPHAYFRFVNTPFAVQTCDLFADAVAAMPEVNLHGDAHIEQYAVTSLGRGISDFDDCTRGKPVIDLVRFAASLLLAAREKGWADEEEDFVSQFLKGYRRGLGWTGGTMPMPELVTRIRAGFHWDHQATLRQADGLIEKAPLPNDAFTDGVRQFSELIRFGRDLPAGFFRVKRIGALTIGVGSALDEKYLMVFEGFTAEDTDDLIVEAKQIRDLSGNSCVRTDVGASRVLDGQRLIAYEPFAYAAVVPHGDKYFWMHDWTDDYQEASIQSVIQTRRELSEISYDAGLQLGRAHPKRHDGVADKASRNEALRSLDGNEARVRAVAREMAARTEAAWRVFRRQVSGQP